MTNQKGFNLKTNQKDYFDKMAQEHPESAILVPTADIFRNKVLDKAMKRTITPLVQSLSGKSILELGCGIGRWANITSCANSVVGVDLSRSMIKIAKNACRGRDCSFVVADASHLPFRDSIFDVVMSVTVLQHILESQTFSKALAEINRCGREALLIEEMSSRKETILGDVYCPIRIVPLSEYMIGLKAVGLVPYAAGGLTFAPLEVIITLFLASKSNLVSGTAGSKAKSSRLISSFIHFVMGLGTLSADFAPRVYYSSYVSLHTMVRARKKLEYIK
jgi:ubiquinone/menaquinone biosynthesis C-methylase UbiE